MTHSSLEFKALIDAFLERRSEQSLRSVALKAGVAPSTLHGIYTQKTPLTYLSAAAVLGIVTTPGMACAFLKEHFPDESGILEKVHAAQGHFKSALSSQVRREFLNSPVKSAVFALCSTRQGTTLERIKQIYGQFGVDALQTLMEGELVVQDGKGRLRNPVDYSVMNGEDLVEELGNRLKTFRTSQLGTVGALLAEQKESVNLATLKAIKEELRATYTRLHALIFDEKNEGPFPVSVGLFMHLLDDTELPEKERKRNEV